MPLAANSSCTNAHSKWVFVSDNEWTDRSTGRRINRSRKRKAGKTWFCTAEVIVNAI